MYYRRNFFFKNISRPEPMQWSCWLCPYNPQPINLVAKIAPFSLSQKNRTALPNFLFRTIIEKFLWRSSAILLPRDFLRYLIAELYVYFTSFSNAPWLHKLSQNKMLFRVCAELLTPWACSRITDWKKTTLSAFHFLARTPSSSTDKMPTNIFPTLPEGAS